MSNKGDRDLWDKKIFFILVLMTKKSILKFEWINKNLFVND